LGAKLNSKLASCSRGSTRCHSKNVGHSLDSEL